MRHNINKFLYTSFVACMLIGGLFFSSCDKTEEDLTTVKLSVFGPSPALRGGELKFIGTNLDKVTAVIISPNIEVSTFVSKTANELVISIPQTAVPGVVKLKTPQGDIETKTPLTFSEPISITTVAPATVKAGDKFTINGDYLNLIAQVIFAEGVTVDSADFVSQSRYKIEVTVPAEAKTGKVIVSNGQEIPVLVYTAAEVQVTLPVITSIAPNPVKPGANLTITGTNFQLVKYLVFPDNLKVETFTVNEAKTEISAIVPETVKEGKVKLVTFSAVEVYSADLQLISPAISSVSPNPVKNGTTITLTGTNLDLVTTASFGGVNGVVLTKSATQVELSVPLTAKEGTIVLGTHSGKTAVSEVVKYIAPTISSIAPLMLMAGGDITLTGTDLDLVRKVKFVGGLSVNVTPVSATSFTVTVPPACVGTAAITLETTNGTQVTSLDQLTVEAANKPVITKLPASVKPGAKMLIEGTKLNLVESIYFQNNVKAVLYGVRTETSIEVYVPETAKKGKVTLTMNAFDGAQIVSPEFTISGTDPIIGSTIMLTNFNGGDNTQSTWGSPFTFGVPSIPLDGSACMIGKSGVSGWTWSWAANWGILPALSNPDNYVFKMDICITKPVSSGVSAGMCFRGWDNSIDLGNIFANSTNGDWVTLTFSLNPGNAIDGTKDYGFFLNCSSEIDLSGVFIDNFRFDLKSSGASGAPKFKLIGF